MRPKAATLALCQHVLTAPRRDRRLILIAGDAACVVVAVPVATLLRFDMRTSAIDVSSLVRFTLVMAVLQVAVGSFFGLYRGRFKYGTFEELAALAKSVIVVAIIGYVLEQTILTSSVPRSVPIVGAAFAMVAMFALRYAWRAFIDHLRRPHPDDAGRAIVFGAGDGGRELITSMLSTPTSPYIPVAILDDDPALRSMRIRGVPVVGGRDALAQLARVSKADVLIIAIPSASGELVREVSQLAADENLAVRVLPSVSQLFGPSVGVDDVRPLEDADLLGRREIRTDLDAIASYVTGRRVLVTGAGGSIGSELCRQLYRFAPASLVLLDRDESALHGTQLSIYGRAMLNTDDVVVADIRDHDRISAVFSHHRPEVVFHAAALKHLPLLEMYPDEAVKTNVWGTMHVLAAAIESDVERFVNISTDKAADPVSTLGYTKRITERLTAWAASEASGTYMSVRFGNVLGSRGSVLTAFRTQIDSGGPVTVTHDDATRYFMTVEEAVQLVIQAGSAGSAGDVFVLDMGEPVRISDVARRLIDESGRDIDIVFTGLRSGEKMHEDLFATGEPRVATDHPLVYRSAVPLLRPVDVARSLAPEVRPEELPEHLTDLCARRGPRTLAAHRREKPDDGRTN